ncbi:hypothetical protein B0T20DRAFT_356452, partial [Sordaria brevicollis]
PPPPLAPLIKSISVSDLDDASTRYEHSTTIEDCETVASYNWLGTNLDSPDILIPGKPRLWKPPPKTPQLKQDSGKFYRDRNAARYPFHPFEPAIATLLHSKPSLVPDLDIVACGSTLGNLLRFVRGEDKPKPFRFLVEKVGNTVFFIRRENSARERIPDVVGYGHTFPKKYTTWEDDVKESWAHQRLVSYRFGGLRFLVRFEADGYLSEEDLPKASPTVTADVKKEEPDIDLKTADGYDAFIEDLFKDMNWDDFAETAEMFRAIKRGSKGKNVKTTDTDSTEQTSSSSSPPPIPASSKLPPPLNIRSNPSPIVPQAQIFDLKTRSIKVREKNKILEDELPRLWVTQIPNFILAYHTSGKFYPSDIEIRDMRPDVKQWEEKHSEDKTLAKLAALVRMLVEMVGELDEMWNGEEVKDDDGKDNVGKDHKEAKGNESSKGKEKSTDHAQPNTFTKPPTPVRIEVVHRAENFGTLKIRHQGWEESTTTTIEGDGRDGALSYKLKQQWFAAQTKQPTRENNPAQDQNNRSKIINYNSDDASGPVGRLLDPMIDSDLSDSDCDPFKYHKKDDDDGRRR